MPQYTVTTEVEFLPEIPAFNPNAGFSFETIGGISLNADLPEFLPEIQWHFAALPPASFTADRRELLRAVNAVRDAIPSRTPRAILQNLRLSVNGSVELTGTDCELGIIVAKEWQREGDRSALIPAQRLAEFLKRAKSPEVTCTLSDKGLSITAGAVGMTIPTPEPVEEYPAVAEIGVDPVIVRFDPAELVDALKCTLFATDTESTRYALGGICFDVSESGVVLAATDTRRLSVYPLSASYAHCSFPEGRQPAHINIPANSLEALLRALPDCSGLVTMRISDNWNSAVFDCPNGTKIYCRAVEGRFPRYQDVIPADFGVEYSFDRADLAESLSAVVVARSEANTGTDWLLGESEITLRHKSPEIGEATARFSANRDLFADQVPAEITFDSAYVFDLLNALPKQVKRLSIRIDRDTVTTHGVNSGADHAALMTADGLPLQYVIMPLSRDR